MPVGKGTSSVRGSSKSPPREGEDACQHRNPDALANVLAWIHQRAIDNGHNRKMRLQ